MIVVHSRKFALLQAIVACTFFFSFFFLQIRGKEYGIFTIRLRFMQIRIFMLFLFFFYIYE